MARKRTAPATPRRRASGSGARKETGARQLGVESGPAPQLDADADELRDDQVDADAGQLGDVVDDRPPFEPPSLVDALEEWETETVALVLSSLLLVFHWTLGRGGPPDAYVPDDGELNGMARPATRMLNRSEHARRLAKHGDGVAFAGAFGGFVVKETREVAEWRAAREGQGPPLEPDLATVGGVTEAGAEQVRGPVRRWRPPTYDDAPPS